MRRAQFPRFATLTATVTLVAAAAGCFETTGQCQRDQDCSGGDVCANTRDCIGAGEVQRVGLRWTVGGAPAGAATCAGIDALEVTIVATRTSESRTYAPVPCPTGVFTFDKLPLAYDRVTLIAYATEGGSERLSAPIIGGRDVQFDLTPRGVPVDAGVP